MLKEPSLEASPQVTASLADAGQRFVADIAKQTDILMDTVGALIVKALANEKQRTESIKSLAGSIAHELCNPLFQIHGSLSLLEQQVPSLNNNAQLEETYRLINGALQVADITLDAVLEKPIDRDSFKLLCAKDMVVQAVMDYAYRDRAQVQKVSVKGEGFKLMAEPVVVKHMLYNLLQNALYAIKTLPDGEIVISLMANVNGVNQIEVRDTGPGIAAEIIPRLFDSFYTLGKQGGTGLGLPYCKRSMHALGGDIDCHSELGRYTAFVLSFPVPSFSAGSSTAPGTGKT